MPASSPSGDCRRARREIVERLGGAGDQPRHAFVAAHVRQEQGATPVGDDERHVAEVLRLVDSPSFRALASDKASPAELDVANYAQYLIALLQNHFYRTITVDNVC